MFIFRLLPFPPHPKDVKIFLKSLLPYVNCVCNALGRGRQKIVPAINGNNVFMDAHNKFCSC